MRQMNRYLFHILLVLVLIKCENVTDHGSNYTSDEPITEKVQANTSSLDLGHSNDTTSTLNDSTPTTTKRTTPKVSKDDNLWIYILIAVILILALIPLYFICHGLFVWCQPVQSMTSTKDTTESTGIKFSTVKTVDSVTGKPINDRKRRDLPDSYNMDKRYPEVSASKSAENMKSYEQVVKKFKDIK